MDVDWLSKPQRLIPPDEVDQVLRRVDESRAHGRELAIEFDTFGTAEHARINADTRVLGIFHEPFDPVFWAIFVTGLDELPT